MKINYRILSVDPKENSIVVRYWTDLITEDSLCNYFDDYNEILRTEQGWPIRCRTDYNLSIWKIDATQEEITQNIMAAAPVDWFKIQEQLIDNQNNNLNDLVGVSDSFDAAAAVPPAPDTPTDTVLTDSQIDALLSQIAANQSNTA